MANIFRNSEREGELSVLNAIRSIEKNLCSVFICKCSCGLFLIVLLANNGLFAISNKYSCLAFKGVMVHDMTLNGSHFARLYHDVTTCNARSSIDFVDRNIESWTTKNQCRVAKKGVLQFVFRVICSRINHIILC